MARRTCPKYTPRDTFQNGFKFFEFNLPAMLTLLQNLPLRSSRSWSLASSSRLFTATARRNAIEEVDEDEGEYENDGQNEKNGKKGGRGRGQAKLGYAATEEGFMKFLRTEGLQFKQAHRPRNWLGGSDTVELTPFRWAERVF